MGNTRGSICLVVLFLVIALAIANPTPMAHAATIIVDTNADDDTTNGNCTLREAIIAANTDTAVDNCRAGVGDDTIDLTGVSGTVDLTGPLPELSSHMVLNGPGAGVLTVRRNSGGNYRIFMVGSGATVIVSGLTVRDGRVVGEWGGGILNVGTLTLTHSAVISNSSDSDGGGVYSMYSLTLDNSTVSGNQAGSRGGGIFNYAGVPVELHDSTVSDNQADRGGGVYNAGTLTLSSSTVSGNGAQQGGGIGSEFGSADLISSTVSGNHASADGGGIWNGGGANMALTNSTVTFNSSSNNGGGIHNTSNGVLVLTNSTVGEFNSAGASGGGIWNDDGGTVSLKNSIVAGNGANSGGPDCHNTATLTSLDHNLLGDSSGCSFPPQPNDQLNVDPLLGPLQDNGGPTETRAPLPGSPAIDAVPPASCADHLGVPIDADQRGITRPQGAACDIGAVEVTASVDLSVIKTVNRINPVVGETIAFAVQTHNHGPLAATGVVISDRLPLGLTFDAAHATQGTYASATGGWQVGRLDAGVGATLTLSATVDAGAAGRTITNTVAISAADQVDLDPTNNVDVVTVIVPAQVRRNYIPLIVREYAPPVRFPLYVGAPIPVRPVAYQGELFYTTSLRIPDALPAGGRFYFSSQRDAVAQVLVDDELVLLSGGTERFSFLFSTAGPPEPAIVELPRAVLETLVGQTVTIEYRDVYGVVIQASEVWLIWVPA